MSRLIDADDLIEYIKIWEIGNSISSDQKEFIDCINRQPTVFDVDEVVRQITDVKEKKDGVCIDVQCELCDYSNDCGEIDMSYKLALDKAIEIVKGCGVE
ncbi:Uncharacterised protein [uncultured Ruminococcus sp.]|nr:Uncharacterised protein [uncultured Ruminococcus sp.]